MKWLFLLLLFAGCSTESPPQLTIFSGNVMTMDYRILIGGALTSHESERIKEQIQEVFDEVNAIYNYWNPDSEISRLNRLPKGTQASLSPKLEKFLIVTQKIVELTEGRFDPTIASIQQLWKSKLTRGTLPSEEEILAVAPSVGWNLIHVENGKFWKDHDLTALDLGGIAKGYCIDLLIESLMDQGHLNIFVEWGGEIRAAGIHPSQRPWKVFISRFGNTNPEEAIAQVDLKDQAIATSGDYMQSWKDPSKTEKTYFHIFNPSQNRPLISEKGSIASASVLAPTCLLADALATAAMIFSSEQEANDWAEALRKRMPELQFWIRTR